MNICVINGSPKGKYATQITTSKRFYDVTAHRYVENNYLSGVGYDASSISAMSKRLGYVPKWGTK